MQISKTASLAERECLIAQISEKFAAFATIRIILVEFYTLLPGKDWRAFEDDLLQPLGQKFSKSLEDMEDKRNKLLTPCYNEINTLRLLHGAQNALQECNSLDSLIMLKQSRDLLDDWFHSLDANSTTKVANSSFFLSFGSRRRSTISRLALLQFLLQFHNTMVAKFSLYFHDTLISFVPHGEMKQISSSSVVNFLQMLQTFTRKNNANTMCLILNRIVQDTPFQGFGYHYNPILAKNNEELQFNSTDIRSNEECSLPSTNQRMQLLTAQTHSKKDIPSGLFDKYPALLFIPSERRNDHSLYATICSFVQEGCGNGEGHACGGVTVSNSNTNLTAESSGIAKIRYLYDKNKEQTFFTACVEGNIHLVVTFERRVQERESSVYTFFNDVLGGLHCTKLFQEIRTMAK